MKFRKTKSKKRTDKLAPCHAKSTPATDKHCTPKAFFEAIQRIYGFKFKIDIAADSKNTLCKKFISEKQNTLRPDISWQGTAWCNPPYSKTYKFVKKAYENARDGHGSTWLLLASRTDTAWWTDYAKYAKIITIRGRLKFGGMKGGAPFPSVILVFQHVDKGRKLMFNWEDPLELSPFDRGFKRKPKGK